MRAPRFAPPQHRLPAILLLALLVYGGGARADRLQDALGEYRIGNYAYAFSTFESLAAGGDAEATFWLGTMWYQGRGRPRNYATALTYYRAAAYQGNARAQNNLALIYRNGESVPPNPVVAYAWFALAAAQNDDTATHNLDTLGQTMTADQILQGQQLSDEYLKRIRPPKPRLPPLPAAVAVSPAAMPATAMPPAAADDVYVVQLGLFRNPDGIARIRAVLARDGIRAKDEAVEIRGDTYHRFRTSPYRTAAEAQTAALRLNRRLNIMSAVIPLAP